MTISTKIKCLRNKCVYKQHWMTSHISGFLKQAKHCGPLIWQTWIFIELISNRCKFADSPSCYIKKRGNGLHEPFLMYILHNYLPFEAVVKCLVKIFKSMTEKFMLSMQKYIHLPSLAKWSLFRDSSILKCLITAEHSHSSRTLDSHSLCRIHFLKKMKSLRVSHRQDRSPLTLQIRQSSVHRPKHCSCLR